MVGEVTDLPDVAIPAGQPEALHGLAGRWRMAGQIVDEATRRLSALVAPTGDGRWWGLGAYAAQQAAVSIGVDLGRARDALGRMGGILDSYARDLAAAQQLAHDAASYRAAHVHTGAPPDSLSPLVRPSTPYLTRDDAFRVEGDAGEAELQARQAAMVAVDALGELAHPPPPPAAPSGPSGSGVSIGQGLLTAVMSMAGFVPVPGLSAAARAVAMAGREEVEAGEDAVILSRGAAVTKDGRRIPLGFPTASSFDSFVSELRTGLQKAGYPDARLAMRGSSVTNVRYKTGGPFDPARSDYDVAIADSGLMDRARRAGILLRQGGRRTVKLGSQELDALGLGPLAQRLSAMTGRDVSLMVYDSLAAVVARGRNQYLLLG